jgi:hypothetical protein
MYCYGSAFTYGSTNFLCAEGGSVYAWGRSIFGRLSVGVAQDELFPTYVEIGTDDDKDSQSSYADSPSASLDFFVTEMEAFYITKLYRWLQGPIIALLFQVP